MSSRLAPHFQLHPLYLSHVSLCSENDGLQAIIGHGQTLPFHHILQPCQDLSVRQFGVTQHSAARLYWLDDFVRGVACKSKTSRLRVDLHDPPQRLLSTVGHTVKVRKQRCHGSAFQPWAQDPVRSHQKFE